ncbi:MAG: hypothetical protein JNL05_12550 [Flavobacteriales bacterium]|nr:hypothetical protein [Flavobacteriales bacterium]
MFNRIFGLKPGAGKDKALVPGHGPGQAGKIFCIGRNKTGTTSLQKAFQDLGYVVGDQRAAELLYDEHYFQRDFHPIIDYCRTAQVFQDVPFSCPYLYVALDQAFPGSKFILSVRDSPEQWYDSAVRFHAKLWGTNGLPPTAEQLRNAMYVRKGWAANLFRIWGTPEEEPYQKDIAIGHYERHNAAVREYFKFRTADLLVLNLAEPGSYQKFIEFLGVVSPFDTFPWENRT